MRRINGQNVLMPSVSSSPSSLPSPSSFLRRRLTRGTRQYSDTGLSPPTWRGRRALYAGVPTRSGSDEAAETVWKTTRTSSFSRVREREIGGRMGVSSRKLYRRDSLTSSGDGQSTREKEGDLTGTGVVTGVVWEAVEVEEGKRGKSGLSRETGRKESDDENEDERTSISYHRAFPNLSFEKDPGDDTGSFFSPSPSPLAALEGSTSTGSESVAVGAEGDEGEKGETEEDEFFRLWTSSGKFCSNVFDRGEIKTQWGGCLVPKWFGMDQQHFLGSSQRKAGDTRMRNRTILSALYLFLLRKDLDAVEFVLSKWRRSLEFMNSNILMLNFYEEAKYKLDLVNPQKRRDNMREDELFFIAMDPVAWAALHGDPKFLRGAIRLFREHENRVMEAKRNKNKTKQEKGGEEVHKTKPKLVSEHWPLAVASIGCMNHDTALPGHKHCDPLARVRPPPSPEDVWETVQVIVQEDIQQPELWEDEPAHTHFHPGLLLPLMITKQSFAVVPFVERLELAVRQESAREAPEALENDLDLHREEDLEEKRREEGNQSPTNTQTPSTTAVFLSEEEMEAAQGEEKDKEGDRMDISWDAPFGPLEKISLLAKFGPLNLLEGVLRKYENHRDLRDPRSATLGAASIFRSALCLTASMAFPASAPSWLHSKNGPVRVEADALMSWPFFWLHPTGNALGTGGAIWDGTVREGSTGSRLSSTGVELGIDLESRTENATQILNNTKASHQLSSFRKRHELKKRYAALFDSYLFRSFTTDPMQTNADAVLKWETNKRYKQKPVLPPFILEGLHKARRMRPKKCVHYLTEDGLWVQREGGKEIGPDDPLPYLCVGEWETERLNLWFPLLDTAVERSYPQTPAVLNPTLLECVVNLQWNADVGESNTVWLIEKFHKAGHTLDWRFYNWYSPCTPLKLAVGGSERVLEAVLGTASDKSKKEAAGRRRVTEGGLREDSNFFQEGVGPGSDEDRKKGQIQKSPFPVDQIDFYMDTHAIRNLNALLKESATTYALLKGTSTGKVTGRQTEDKESSCRRTQPGDPFCSPPTDPRNVWDRQQAWAAAQVALTAADDHGMRPGFYLLVMKRLRELKQTSSAGWIAKWRKYMPDMKYEDIMFQQFGTVLSISLEPLFKSSYFSEEDYVVMKIEALREIYSVNLDNYRDADGANALMYAAAAGYSRAISVIYTEAQAAQKCIKCSRLVGQAEDEYDLLEGSLPIHLLAYKSRELPEAVLRLVSANNDASLPTDFSETESDREDLLKALFSRVLEDCLRIKMTPVGQGWSPVQGWKSREEIKKQARHRLTADIALTTDIEQTTLWKMMSMLIALGAELSRETWEFLEDSDKDLENKSDLEPDFAAGRLFWPLRNRLFLQHTHQRAAGLTGEPNLAPLKSLRPWKDPQAKKYDVEGEHRDEYARGLLQEAEQQKSDSASADDDAEREGGEDNEEGVEEKSSNSNHPHEEESLHHEHSPLLPSFLFRDADVDEGALTEGDWIRLEVVSREERDHLRPDAKERHSCIDLLDSGEHTDFHSTGWPRDVYSDTEPVVACNLWSALSLCISHPNQVTKEGSLQNARKCAILLRPLPDGLSDFGRPTFDLCALKIWMPKRKVGEQAGASGLRRRHIHIRPKDSPLSAERRPVLTCLSKEATSTEKRGSLTQGAERKMKEEIAKWREGMQEESREFAKARLPFVIEGARGTFALPRPVWESESLSQSFLSEEDREKEGNEIRHESEAALHPSPDSNTALSQQNPSPSPSSSGSRKGHYVDLQDRKTWLSVLWIKDSRLILSDLEIRGAPTFCVLAVDSQVIVLNSIVRKCGAATFDSGFMGFAQDAQKRLYLFEMGEKAPRVDTRLPKRYRRQNFNMSWEGQRMTGSGLLLLHQRSGFSSHLIQGSVFEDNSSSISGGAIQLCVDRSAAMSKGSGIQISGQTRPSARLSAFSNEDHFMRVASVFNETANTILVSKAAEEAGDFPTVLDTVVLAVQSRGRQVPTASGGAVRILAVSVSSKPVEGLLHGPGNERAARIHTMHAVFRNCLFRQNRATDWGGALTSYGAALRVEGCDFKKNLVVGVSASSTADAGAISASLPKDLNGRTRTSAILKDSLFEDNRLECTKDGLAVEQVVIAEYGGQSSGILLKGLVCDFLGGNRVFALPGFYCVHLPEKSEEPSGGVACRECPPDRCLPERQHERECRQEIEKLSFQSQSSAQLTPNFGMGSGNAQESVPAVSQKPGSRTSQGDIVHTAGEAGWSSPVLSTEFTEGEHMDVCPGKLTVGGSSPCPGKFQCHPHCGKELENYDVGLWVSVLLLIAVVRNLVFVFTDAAGVGVVKSLFFFSNAVMLLRLSEGQRRSVLRRFVRSVGLFVNLQASAPPGADEEAVVIPLALLFMWGVHGVLVMIGGTGGGGPAVDHGGNGDGGKGEQGERADEALELEGIPAQSSKEGDVVDRESLVPSCAPSSSSSSSSAHFNLLERLYIRVFGFFLVEFYPFWLLYVARMLKCIQVPGQDHPVIFYAPAVECRGNFRALLWFTLVLLTLVPVGVFFFIKTAPREKPLVKPVIAQLAGCFNERYEWWDAVFLVRRLVLVALVALENSERTETVIANGLFVLMLFHHLVCRRDTRRPPVRTTGTSSAGKGSTPRGEKPSLT
uniref:Uncharacterized protein n=1 Tax=Chromera velia CCMP2878 TaxID=1169474 RepID=A0A0G4FWX9_9ALVE|eukprot:Cvel_3806.t1-p1 / transcript=Cvel_3806.t1 / gene=Cvel_3806 / organism=Chromera_velia_CCMP2878 / gene_product=hypothetical protein / transcript_product=hypothetical protein / location=Cvel_scaffold160:53064-74346(+) / protein_length=2633 / sequence_SO=supercontig / SO=protein_coding / is_pseudo=false